MGGVPQCFCAVARKSLGLHDVFWAKTPCWSGACAAPAGGRIPRENAISGDDFSNFCKRRGNCCSVSLGRAATGRPCALRPRPPSQAVVHQDVTTLGARVPAAVRVAAGGRHALPPSADDRKKNGSSSGGPWRRRRSGARSPAALQRLAVGGITAHLAAILRFSAATRLPRGDVDCQKLCERSKLV